MYMDDIKLYAKIEKELEKLIQTVRMNIQSRYRDGIWLKRMHHVSYEKQKTANNGWNGTTISRKIRTFRENGTFKYLGILEKDTIK